MRDADVPSESDAATELDGSVAGGDGTAMQRDPEFEGIPTDSVVSGTAPVGCTAEPVENATTLSLKLEDDRVIRLLDVQRRSGRERRGPKENGEEDVATMPRHQRPI